MLGFPLLYFKGMRKGLLMFQLSGFYYRGVRVQGFGVKGLGLIGLWFR